MNPYTKVTNYDEDENYVAHTEIVVGRGYRSTRTIYLPKGQSNGVAIPQRNQGFSLDLSKIAEAKAHAEKIRNELWSK